MGEEGTKPGEKLVVGTIIHREFRPATGTALTGREGEVSGQKVRGLRHRNLGTARCGLYGSALPGNKRLCNEMHIYKPCHRHLHARRSTRSAETGRHKRGE